MTNNNNEDKSQWKVKDYLTITLIVSLLGLCVYGLSTEIKKDK